MEMMKTLNMRLQVGLSYGLGNTFGLSCYNDGCSVFTVQVNVLPLSINYTFSFLSPTVQ